MGGLGVGTAGRRGSGSTVSGVTYDTGALVAADRGDRRMWLLHRRTLDDGVVPIVPAGVLAQAWRGGPQPQLSRLLAGCQVEALDEPRARSAGTGLALAKTSDVVDASVAVGAAVRGDLVVTSDAHDMEHLASALNLRIDTVTI